MRIPFYLQPASMNVGCMDIFKGSPQVNWLYLSLNEVSLSRLGVGQEKVMILTGPGDWRKADFNKQMLATINSLQGVEDLSRFRREGFCIFVERIEDLLQREEFLYLVLGSGCPLMANCTSLDGKNLLSEYIEHSEFDLKVLSGEFPAIKKLFSKDRKLIQRRYSWLKKQGRNVVIIGGKGEGDMELAEFFRLRNMPSWDGIYFLPGLLINRSLLIKCLPYCSVGRQPPEIMGNFTLKIPFTFSCWLEKHLLDQLIQWQYGNKLI